MKKISTIITRTDRMWPYLQQQFIAIANFVFSTGKHCKEFRCFHIDKIVLFSNFILELSEKI